jgi:hypothetical protein
VSTTAPSAERVPVEGRSNPYVGPRAFRTGEPLYARDREKSELGDLIVAERILLLHAPSGAGKTSLIRAALRPLLAARRFQPTVPLRVNMPPPKDLEVHNRYVFSVACGLLPDEQASGLAGLDFRKVLESVQARMDGGFLVLVFDQFEEILTLDPTDWEGQRTFFKEVGEALAGGSIWALFSMREDYMGGLDRFIRYIPGHLRATYRLDFLTRAAATIAIQSPARAQDVEFTDEAAAELVRRLALMRIQRPNRETAEVEAPYVQPVQLQVVCRKLWKSVSKAKGREFDDVDLDDVRTYADIPKALRGYYAGAVEEIAEETGVDEVAIRDWFGQELITREGFRSQTVQPPDCGSVDPRIVLAALESAYLIRSDVRANVPWFELTHDLLIEPIREDNGKWNRRRLEPWQLAARAWGADRQVGRLLSGSDLREASRHLDRPGVTDLERDFVAESQRAEKEKGRLARTRQMVSLVGAVACFEAAVIIVLVFLLLSR